MKIIKTMLSMFIVVSLFGCNSNSGNNNIDSSIKVGTISPAEYAQCCGKVGPDFITINMQLNGETPDGYEIYRRESGTKDFKLIDTVNTHDFGISYVDKDISMDHSYDYQVKAFRKVNGKIDYSTFEKENEFITMVPDNHDAVFDVSSVTKEGKTKEIVLCIKSLKDNNDVTFSLVNGFDSFKYQTWDEKTETGFSYDSGDILFSKDCKDWTSLKDKDIVIKQNEEMYLKLVLTEEASYLTSQSIVFDNNIIYRNRPCLASFIVDDGSFTITENGEYLH